jgi:hypothetical protein
MVETIRLDVLQKRAISSTNVKKDHFYFIQKVKDKTTYL